jgi:hypothetical protein
MRAAGRSEEADMRNLLAALALGCAFVAALSVTASACEYNHSTSASTNDSGQTAQAQPASSQD